MTNVPTLEQPRIRRRRGRPKGTGYTGVDAPLHEVMRLHLERHSFPSRTAAAKSVAHRAYGGGSLASKVTRLVRTYPY